MVALIPGAARAQGPWGAPGWYGPGGMHRGWDAAAEDRTGTVTTAVFRAAGAEAVLGHGAIAVVAMPAVADADEGDRADGRYGDGRGGDGGNMARGDGGDPARGDAGGGDGGDMARGDGRGPMADAGAALPPPGAPGIAPGPADPFGREQATFEAAVLDRLARAGYATALPGSVARGAGTGAGAGAVGRSAGAAAGVPAGGAAMAPGGAVAGAPGGAGAGAPAGAGQIAEVRVTHALAAPGEPPHKPVSGEMAVGVSNRGSGMALGLNIDLSKPRGPVIATRLEVRIRDAATGRALWEGRADIATREGDGRWSDDRIAGKLAAALFAGFPRRGGGG